MADLFQLQITRLDIDYGEGGPYGKEKLRAVMANHMTEYDIARSISVEDFVPRRSMSNFVSYRSHLV